MPDFLTNGVVRIQDFLVAGGDVLLLIAGVTFVMWTLIAERVWFFLKEYPGERERVRAVWESRRETHSWYAHQIRRGLIADISGQLHRSLSTIQTLVALCTLLGLLGTVTGMMEVFQVMAVTGNSSARAMAGGVSKATIPTMAGMVAALSGLYLAGSLQRWADRQTAATADLLTQRADA